jgi:hypothetical protein
MLGQRLGEGHAVAGDDIDDARWHVGGFDDLIEIGDGQPTARWHQHHRIAHCQSRRQQADRAQQGPGLLSGATMPMTPSGSTMAAATARSGGLCTAPSYLSAQPAKAKSRSTESATSAVPGLAGLCLEARGEFIAAIIEVFGEEVEDLGP